MTFRRSDRDIWARVDPAAVATYQAAILGARDLDPWREVASAYRDIIEASAAQPLERVMRNLGFGDIALAIDLDAIALRHLAAR